MKLKQFGLVLLAALALGACGKQEVTTKKDEPPPPVSAAAPVPDVGKIDTVSTKADGYGATPAAATADAMKTAILQVNGATIDTSSVVVKYGLDVTDGVDAVSLRATEFAEKVAQKSGGAITNFKVLEVVEPKAKGGQYKVSIEANIAHFTAPANTKKIKVVVAPMKFDVAAFNIGGESVPSSKVAEDIRQQVSTALTNTGRFSILDREITADIQSELDMIKAGDAPRAETGKLGQAVTADVIWTGRIDTLGYNRHARQLRTSDRELVSYSGGWGVSQKLVNVATRQIMTSDTLQGKAPDVAPTTMGSGINAGQVLQGMVNDIANEIVASILTRTFPITVVSREGNTIVLSQGGQSVKVGARYAMVAMGKEMKDPQTGESLGRMESPCCEVVVDKVTPKLSYGHLENIKVSLDNIPEGGLQLREQVKALAKSEPEDTKAPSSNEVSAVAVKPVVATKRPEKAARPESSSIQDKKEDGKW
jgi:curli biogenesis system outer membrane secretion channel CsgG